MPPTGVDYHLDWVFSSESNVHVVRDPEWFTELHPLRTTIKAFRGPPHLTALGFGTVEIRPVGTEAENGVVVLTNVLYVPQSIVNIIGNPILRGNTVQLGPQGGKVMDPNGSVIFPIDGTVMCRVRLEGQVPRPHSLATSAPAFYVKVHADESLFHYMNNSVIYNGQYGTGARGSFPALPPLQMNHMETGELTPTGNNAGGIVEDEGYDGESQSGDTDMYTLSNHVQNGWNPSWFVPEPQPSLEVVEQRLQGYGDFLGGLITRERNERIPL